MLKAPQGFGYSKTTTANLMTVPPYIAGAVGVWIMAWSSDRFNERAFHLLGSQLITILGLILTIVILVVGMLDSSSSHWAPIHMHRVSRARST